VVRFIIPILALVVIIYLISQLKFQGYLQQLASAIISGGAIGNVIDRILYGKVVDFLDFHIGGYHWPAFNIADVAICTGIAIWIYASINTSSTQGEG
jgi:signal peptidase II